MQVLMKGQAQQVEAMSSNKIVVSLLTNNTSPSNMNNVGFLRQCHPEYYMEDGSCIFAVSDFVYIH